ncbi:MAG: right-handed parallel beta-helix repeat-containing protein [Elusimicrobia bacterium]|nr:right-handed parallel beta-helix repeat-containing protein [Elusimicrobiota bacterium]
MSAARGLHTATLLPSGKVLVAGGSSGGGTYLSSAELYDPASGTWAATGPMAAARGYHTAVLLPNGKVLVVGGETTGGTALSIAELYDPASGTWAGTGALSAARRTHTLTLLANGKVLAAGGYDGTNYLSSAELYDPSVGTWSGTGSMSAARHWHTATLLPSGKVLAAGGESTGGAIIAAAEVYDPSAGTWSATGPMSAAREYHASTLLPNGLVLAAGGYNNGDFYLSSADLYNPAFGTWSSTGALAAARGLHAATLLPNGRVLAAGGGNLGGYLSSAEVFDPSAGAWTSTGPMSAARELYTATLLPDGRVLMVGGRTTGDGYLSSAEVFRPSAGAWEGTGGMGSARRYHTATLLPNGKVLAAGWLITAELYDPIAGTWSGTGSMNSLHTNWHTATLLPSGKVLAAGGYDGDAMAAAELYDPSAGTWSVTGSMTTARQNHTATLLPNGKVLVAGGSGAGASNLSTAELYDSVTGTWSETGPMSSARDGHTAVLLPNGNVLVAGGWSGGETLFTAEIYDPAAGTWAATGSMASRRRYHTATLLPNGNVLAAGGASDIGFAYLSAAELYDPSAGTWAATGSMSAARRDHTATLLPSGRVLVAGGYNGAATSAAELYDPTAGAWSSAGPMGAAREDHTATLLPNGKVLAAGGYDGGVLSSAETASYTEYSYSAISSSVQPKINTVNGSAVFPAALTQGDTYAVTGTTFTGLNGGSGGGCADSSANLPRVYLMPNDSGNYGTMAGGGRLIDLSTSIYGAVEQTNYQNYQSSTNLAFTVPSGLQCGYYQLFVMANAIPSDFVSVQILPPALAVSPTAASPAFTNVYVSSFTAKWTPSAEPGVANSLIHASTASDFSGNPAYGLAIKLTGSSFTFTGLWPNSTYYFRAAAENCAGAGPWSGSLGATSTISNPIANPAFYRVFATSATVNWNPLPTAAQAGSSSTAEGYVLQGSTAANFSGVLYSSATANISLSTLTLTGLSVNTTCYFRVATLNWNGVPNTLAAGSTVTAIEAPASVVFDEISTCSITASAYAPEPAFSNLSKGLSGINLTTGAYGSWHSTGDVWTAKASMLTWRYLSAVAAIGAKLYAVGGSNGLVLSANEEYDPAANSWSSKASMPTGRHGVAAAAIGGRFYAVGGYNGAAMPANEEYDPAANAWTGKAFLPTPRYYLAAASISGRLYAVGGSDSGGSPAANNEEYDPVSNTWSSKASMPTARNSLAAAAVGGKLYAVGGSNGVAVSANEEYDPGANNWTGKAAMPTPATALAAAAVGGRLYALGGSGSLYANQEYDVAGNTWTSRAAIPSPRYGFAAAAVRGRICAVGSQSGGYEAANEEYDPGRSQTFAGLLPNKQYSFKAKARNAAGMETAESPMVSTYTLAVASLPLPGTPMFPNVLASSLTVNWSSGTAGTWFNGSGATYLVEASTMPTFIPTAASSLTANTFASLTWLLPNTIYYFRVQAYSSTGGTDFSWLVLGSTVPRYLPPGCGMGFNVRQDGSGDFASIQAALDALPKSLGTTACVVILDTGTYSEQVTVQGFANNGFQLKIMSDPSFASSAPAVSPPALSTAGFLIQNASVTLQNLSVLAANPMPYGVQASSAYVTLSSVSVSGGSAIYSAGISLSSWSAVSYSSVTVQNAHGIWLAGSRMTTAAYSSATTNNSSYSALFLQGASSNTISVFSASNLAGYSAVLAGGADYNTISDSTMTSNAAASVALYINNSDSNTVTRSFMSNPAGHSALLDGGADYNTISDSTMTSNAATYVALYIYDSDSNTVTRSFISNPADKGARLESGADYNTISDSTMTGGVQALYISNSDLNTVTRSYITTPAGYGAYLYNGADYNTISDSTMTSDSTYSALYIANSDSNTVTRSFMSNPAGHGAYLNDGADNNTISDSTVTSNSLGNVALYIANSDSNTVTRSFMSNSAGTGASLGGGADNNTISDSTMISNADGSNALYIWSSDSNTVARSFMSNPAGYGAVLYTGADYNTILDSTMSGGGFLYSALRIWANASNTVRRSFMSNPTGYGARLDGGAVYNTISDSTMTSGGYPALYIDDSDSNMVTRSFMSNPAGYGAALSGGADHNTISDSTMTSNAASYSPLYIGNSDSNTVTRSFMSNPAGTGAYLYDGADYNTISDSTMTGYYGLYLYQSSSNTIASSYIQGSTAVYVRGSTGTVISSSVLVGMLTSGSGLWMYNSSVNLSVSSSVISGGTQGAAVYLDAANSGELILSSITVQGAGTGVLIAQQAAGASLSIASMTFRSLPAGATAISFLSATMVSTFSRIDFSDAGIAVNVNAAALGGGSRITMDSFLGSKAGPPFENDPNGYVDWPGFLAEPLLARFTTPNRYLIAGTTVSISTATQQPIPTPIDVELFSFWGDPTPSTWAYHTVSVKSLDSTTTRAGTDPTKPVKDGVDWRPIGPGYSALPVNIDIGFTRARFYIWDTRLGTATLQASVVRQDGFAMPVITQPEYITPGSAGLPAGCGEGRNVKQDGSQHFTTIQAALDSLDPGLSTKTCVVIRDTQTYNEQVTIQGFDTSGFRLNILADPSFISSAPVISPPALSTAAFLIQNDSATLQNLRIVPAGAVSYGVKASSAYFTADRLVVDDAGGFIGEAGLAVSSWSAVSNSSISVPSATGLRIEGAGSSVSDTTAAIQTSLWHFALRLSNASGNTITRSFFSGDKAVRFESSNANTLSLTTATASATALSLASSSTNTIAGCAISGAVYGLYGDNANHNVVSRSTLASAAVPLYLAYSASNAITSSLMRSETTYGAYLHWAANYNTIANSTITSRAPGGLPLTSALFISGGSSNTIADSYIQGATAAWVTGGAAGTQIQSSVLATTHPACSGLWLSGSAVNLSLSSNTLIGGSQGAGARVEDGAGGDLVLSSSTVRGGRWGLIVAGPSSGASLSIATMTFQDLSAGATAIQFLSGVFVSTFSNVSFAGQGLAVNVDGSGLGAGARISMRSASGPKAGRVFENDPYNRVFWLGYIGDFPPGCATAVGVRKDGDADYASIQTAVDGSPKALTGDSCVVIRDASTYGEQVTVMGFANNGYQLKIMADPGFVSSAPVVSPPALSTAAFLIQNASVTLGHISIAPADAVSYGIQISSPYVVLNSVSVDGGSKIGLAAVALSSWDRISLSTITCGAAGARALYAAGASSITVQDSILSSAQGSAAYLRSARNISILRSTMTSGDPAGAGLWLADTSSSTISDSAIWNSGGSAARIDGNVSYNAILRSTMTANAQGYYALSIVNSSSNTVSDCALLNRRGDGAYLSAARYNAIERSAITSNWMAYRALYLNGASRNTISDSFLYNPFGYGAYLSANSDRNTILRSTAAGNSSSEAALHLAASASNTITQSFVLNPSGHAAVLGPGSDLNSVTLSTLTSSGESSNALYIEGNSSNSIQGSYLQASTAVYVRDSTGTVFSGDILMATHTAGSGLGLGGGNVNFTLISSTVAGGRQGAGIYLSGGNTGELALLADVVAGGRYGILIASQTANLTISTITFQSLAPGAAALVLAPGRRILTFSRLNFADPGIAVNVDAGFLEPGSHVMMISAFGSRAGPLYENDPNSLVDWSDFNYEIYAEGFTDVFTSSLSVLWSSSFPSGTRYYAQLSTASDFTGAVLSSATYGLAATFTGLSPNVPYYARASYSPSGPFTILGTAMPALLPGPPGAPSGTALGVSSIAWTWSAASDAVGYRILQASNLGAQLGTSAVPHFEQIALATNTAYGIVAGATNPSGLGPLSPSATAYTLAAPPSGAAVSSVEGASATLSWSLNTNPAWTIAEVERSVTGAAFISVFKGSATAYTDYYLLGCTTYTYRVRNRNGDGIPSAYGHAADFTTKGSTPLPPGGLSAESLAGRRIRVSWEPSPSEGIVGYRLYYDSGTGTLDTAALAVFSSTVTSYLTEPLSSGVSYKFALRAINRCGVEEQNARLLAAATAVESLTGVQAAIKVPQGGKKIMGNRVTVLAELIRGDAGQTKRIRFQYKGVAEADWHDIVVPVQDINHPNPATDFPYLVHWDVTAVSTGDYQLMAAATDIFGAADTSPPSIVVSVSANPADCDINETSLGAGMVLKQQVVHNSVENSIAAADEGSKQVTKVVIPAEALDAGTVTVSVVNNSAGGLVSQPGINAIGVSVEITLSNGQSRLAGGRTAALELYYPDEDDDGIVDGKGVRVENLELRTHDPATGEWRKEFASTVDRTNKKITGYTPHFSLFAVVAPMFADLSSLTVYPVPFKPNNAIADDGVPYDSGIANSGIIFNNLPDRATITIYTVTGQKVKHLDSRGAVTVPWDVTNEGGQDAASGVYLAVIKSPGQKAVVRKIAVIR